MDVEHPDLIRNISDNVYRCKNALDRNSSLRAKIISLDKAKTKAEYNKIMDEIDRQKHDK